MTAEPLAALELGSRWTPMGGANVGRALRLRYDGDTDSVEVELQRCLAGRLREAYPVSAHDVEVRVANGVAPACVASLLADLGGAIMTADTHCRRVIFAVASGNLAMVEAAESAGFRYVLDVDVPGEELSLLVAEPKWVTRVDADLDRVPGA